MKIIDGKKIAEDIYTRLRARPTPKKFLAGVLVGQDKASLSYQKAKQKAAQSLNVDYRLYELPENLSQDELRKKIGEIAAHKTCGGVVVQLPLPEGVDKNYVLNAIPREKDPDVLSERSLGALYVGRAKVLPPAVGAVEEILASEGWSLAGKKVVVVGAGMLVGKPVASWLIGKARELVVLDRGSDFGELRSADLIILGTGKPNLIESEFATDGAGVIDFGYAKDEDGRVGGDFDPTDSENKKGFYTPTPGGTGPIVIAKLIENFYNLQHERD